MVMRPTYNRRQGGTYVGSSPAPSAPIQKKYTKDFQIRFPFS